MGFVVYWGYNLCASSGCQYNTMLLRTSFTIAVEGKQFSMTTPVFQDYGI